MKTPPFRLTWALFAFTVAVLLLVVSWHFAPSFLENAVPSPAQSQGNASASPVQHDAPPVPAIVSQRPDASSLAESHSKGPLLTPEILQQLAATPLQPPRLGTEELDSSVSEKIAKDWPQARVLSHSSTRPDASGLRRQVAIIQPQDLPYRIRLEQVIGETPEGGKVLQEQEIVADHVLVQLAADQDPAALAAALAPLGLKPGLQVSRRGLWRANLADPLELDALPEALRQLNEKPTALRFAESDGIVRVLATPNDTRYLDGSLWGLHNTGQNSGTADADIDAPEGWAVRTSATNVIVGVIDTGIRLTHQDLAANLWVNPNETANGADSDANGFIDDLHGINAITLSGDPTDDNGHGTHVAGTIGAVGNNGVGVTGVAWNVRLMGLKFLGVSGGATSDAITCIDYGVENGAHILSNSWGGGGFSQALLDSIQAARDAGVIFVVAAGNSATDNDASPIYPAALPVDNIVTIASTTRTDDLSPFSCYGQGSVDLGAPGSDILSTGYESDSSYVSLNGTSMATPHVSGALALLRAQFPTDTWDQLVHRLYRGGDTLPSLANGKIATGRRLNLHRALTTTSNRPVNDDFADGRVVHGEQVVLRATLRSATAEPGEPALAGEPSPNTLWYRFTPAATGLTSVTALAGESVYTPGSDFPVTVNYDVIPLVFGIYTGNSVGALTPVASGADALSFSATAGTTYHIAVAGQAGAQGLAMIEITGAPANSTLANASTLVLNTPRYGTNRNALPEPGEPAHAGQPATASVWYKWTAGLTGRVAFTTRGSDFDTVAAVYSGPVSNPTFAALTPVDSNDNAPGTTLTFSRVEFQAISGTTYYIALDGRNGATGNVAATLAIPPANDAFANAAVLSGTDVTRTLSTAFGSRETGEPSHWPNAGSGETVWFTWTAPESGRTTLDLADTFFRGIIAVYTGSSVDALSLVSRDGAGNRFAQVTFDATQGTTYRIAVDSWDFSLTNAPLRLRMVPIPTNDQFAAATEMLGLRPTLTGSNVGGTRETGEPSANSNGGPSVWHKWTAPATGTYGLYGERLNKPDQWIIVLNVFTGSSVNTLTHVKEDLMNGIGRDAFARFTATAGVTYYFQVTGLISTGITGGVGPYRLDLRPIAEHAPVHDNFADALPLDGSPVFNFRTQNYGASAEPGESSHSGYAPDRTIWWKFAVPPGQAGQYVVATTLSEGSVGTTIYRAANPANPTLGALTQVASNVEFANQNFPNAKWQAEEGQVYYIVADRYEGARGRVVFNFQKVPANITFANAKIIPAGGLEEVTYNFGSVHETGEPTGGFSPAVAGRRSLWWRWTAPASGRYQVDTLGSQLGVYEDAIISAQFGSPTLLGLDTVLGVYTGSALGALTTVATNSRVSTYSNSNWSYQRNSRLEFDAVAGTTYQIMVNGHCLGTTDAEKEQNTHQGQIRFRFTRLTPPANDAFTNATEITGTAYQTLVTNLGATKETGEPNHGGRTNGRTLWWRWTAPESGTFIVSTAGNIYDDYNARQTGLGVYTGSSVSALTTITSNSNGAGVNTGEFTWSAASFTAVAGTTYHFGVDSAYAGNLSFLLTRPAANDSFANATVMQGSRWTATGHNLLATVEPGETKIESFGNPPPVTDVTVRSVWWRWTAPVSGPITLDALGSQMYNVMGVYTGSALGALTPIVVTANSGDFLNGEGPNRARSGTKRVTFEAVAGTTYHITIQGAGYTHASSGPITLALVGPPAVPFAPENFTALRTEASRIDLGWDDIAVDEEYYELQRSTDGSNWLPLQSTAPDVETYTDFDTAGTGDFHYRVRAVNTVGASAWVSAAVTTPQPPTTPANFTGTPLSTTSIQLAWSAPANAEYYRLERSATGNLGPWTVLAADLTATTYLDSALTPGTTYWYRLRATNALGSSPWTAVVTAVTANTSILVQDPFTDADRTNGADPLDVAWSVTGNTFAVIADPTLDPTSPNRVAELSISTSNKDEYLAFALPSAVTLAVGDTLAVSFKLRHTGAPRPDASGTGVSLAHTGNNNPWANAVNRDYFFVTSYGANGTLGSIRRNAEGNGAQVLNSNASTTTLASGLASVDAGTSVLAVSFEATRTGESSMRLRYRLGDGPVQEVTDTGASIITAFNRVFLRFRTRTDSATPAFRIDDVTVTRSFPVAPSEPQPPITAWRQTHFGTTIAIGESADNADPDGDGVVNLLEYALEGDPLLPGTATLPELGSTLVGDEEHMTLTVTKNPDATDMNFLVETSTSLSTWHSGEGHTVIMSETATRLVVRTFAPMSDDTRRFLRLRVIPIP